MLELCTGSRLHFGLLELAVDQPHRFGGLGLMIQSPQVHVRVARPGRLELPHANQREIEQRVQSALEHAQRKLGRALEPTWTVEVVEHPLLHSGLGVGTQLAAAVSAAAELAISVKPQGAQATSLAHWQPVAPASNRCDRKPIRELAGLSGRGKRSAIGLHGFLYGGLVQDMGYNSHIDPTSQALTTASDEIRVIATRSVTFPESWPIVLILGSNGGDMHGATEESLINAAGATRNRQRETMLALSETCMEAAENSNFNCFVEALEEYMKFAASLFESVQAGRYRDEIIAQRVETATRVGLRGVGQSSWGPTVFGFASQAGIADQAASELRSQLSHQAAQVIVTTAADHGARWRTTLSGVQNAG